MSYVIATIESAIENILKGVSELKSITTYEGKIIPKLPAATLFYSGFNQSQTEAVSFTINHMWILRIYVELNDAERAQTNMKTIVGKVLEAFKADISLGDTVDKGIINAGDVGVLLDRNNPQMVAELTIEGMKEED